MKRPVPIHGLRPNETEWTPPAVAFFDTETASRDDGGNEVHTLRCWSARLDVRRDRRKTVTWHDSDDGTIAADLATLLADWSLKHPTLWVYAHNLAFDLTVSAVTSHLADAGWHVTEFAFDSPSPFVKMSDGRHVITFADSFSWLPARLADVAAAVGQSKTDLPGNDDDPLLWTMRCRTDVDILATAMLEIMQWWDDNHLGHWSVTGSSSGWNAMRHIIDARRIVINPSPEGIEADRAAIYGGRRGLWRTGKLPGGRYADLDFTAAYPTIAESMPLPCERMAHFASLPLDHPWVTSERHGIIARVRIQTATPRWPVAVDRRVWYPIGEFWTTLAGPDIAEAARLGCLREIGSGWLHRLGYVLRPWASWVLTMSSGNDDQVPAVVRMWSKHCGRAVIGKWGQRSYSTVKIGPSPVSGWHADEGWNHSAGVRAVIIDFDGWRWQACADGEGDNSYPAVLAWVESYVRVRLGRMIDAMPAGAVLACDTDGLIVDMNALGDYWPAASDVAPLSPRVKQEYRVIDITGPQHMVVDGQRRYAGVPASAKPAPDGTLTAQLWPKMVWQMGNGTIGTYTRPTQTYRLAATYAPGWVHDGGQVSPVESRVTDNRETAIAAWEASSYAARGCILDNDQNPALERYRNDLTQTRH